MEEIKNLQNKYASCVTALKLHEVINEYGNQINQVVHKRNQQMKEHEDKIEKLKSELIVWKKNMYSEKQILEEKNKQLSYHNRRLDELKSEYNKFTEECQNLQVKKNHLKNTKPNQEDQKLLTTGRKKLWLYKDLTGIRWDYSNIKNSLEGYVTNKKDYIHHFKFSADEKDLEESSNLLWREIYRSIKNILDENKEVSSG